MSLTFQSVSHSYDGATVVNAVDLEAKPGEILCLLGPSGSGKSTLLRLAAGLEAVQSGCLTLDGQRFADPTFNPPPEQRSVSLVFQDHVLYPHKTVAQNVAFGLHGLDAGERDSAVTEHLHLVGLHDLRSRYPDTLSGGQQQRVGLARALATRPRVMLLDEPFASVDATRRRALRENTRRTLRAAGTITIVVTHDPVEAMELADTIAYMSNGRLRQTGTPREIWETPQNADVAAAFGESQILTGTQVDRVIRTAFGDVPCPASFSTAANSDVDVLIRPSAISLSPSDSANHSPTSTIEDIRFLGDGYTVFVVANGERLRTWQQTLSDLEVGQEVTVAFDPAGVFLFDESDRPVA